MIGRTRLTTDLKPRILARIQSVPDSVWTPTDFADIGSRAAVDKALQRLVAAGDLRRIDRGLYDRPRLNTLTGRTAVPDYLFRIIARRGGKLHMFSQAEHLLAR